MSTPPVKFRAEDSFYAFTVRRPVSILMVVLAVVVFGWVSNQRLALTLMPNMSYPTLTVRTVYPGTAPEEMESVVSRPLEQQLGVIPKLVSISSVSKAGQSDVMLEFQWKTDMDLVAQEVREKIDRLRLPEGAQRPLLLHFDPSLDPILRVGLAGPQSLFELRHLAEHEVKRRLESLNGVAAVQVKGGLEEQFLVAIDESKLAQLRLDITQIGQRLQSGNVNMPGGNLREGQTEYVIRTLNEFKTIEEIGALIISRSNNAVDIRLRDIATVTRFHKDRDVITRVNGRESVEIEIFKEADANIVKVAETVRNALFGTAEQQAWIARDKAGENSPAALAAREKRGASSVFDMKVVASGKGESSRSSSSKKTEKASAGSARSRAEAAQLESRKAALAEVERLRAAAQEQITRRQMTAFIGQQLPPGATVELLADQSVFISKSIDEVKNNAISGAIIAVIVLYLFLRNLVQTLIIGLSIPISIVATFAPMHMAGVSLNIISLGGLALGVGMLVDNAIVVLESIFRCREEGDELQTAVVRGTQEVGMAVGASTLTTVAVFLPIVFVEGVAGQVFGDMALTVVFSLLASLGTALFLIPMLASRKFEAPATGWRTQTSAYLGFTPAPAGAGVARQLGRIAGLAMGRIAWVPVLIVAVVLKALAVVAFLLLWPLLAGISLFAWRGMRAWWPAFTAWATADRLWRIEGARIWPGLLSFSAPATLAAGLGGTWGWLTARHWRWIGLLVLPALAVGAVLYFSKGVTVPPVAQIFGASASALPPLKPLHLSVWHWLVVQPWWWLVILFVPGAVPLAFSLMRAVAEVVLRLVGSIVLAALLAVAVLVLGVGRLAAVLGGSAAGRGLDGFERLFQRLQRFYPRLIAVALRRRHAVLGGSVAAFLVCWFVLVPRLGKELIPQVHQGEFNLDVTLPIGTPLERTAEVVAQIDDAVRVQPEVERTALTVGAEEGASTSISAGEHTARLSVKLKSGLPSDAEPDLIDRIRERFRELPAAKIEVSYPTLFSFRSPVEVEIRGHDLVLLKRLSREAEALLAETVPGLVDVRSSLQSGHPEIQVVYKRDRLAEYGLNLRSVADLVRNKVQGRTATEFRKEDQMIDIVVRLREQDRLGIEELRNLIVNPSGSVPIPLAVVADLTINEGPSEIRRVDQQRTALITANLRDADLSTVSRDIVTALDGLEFPAGFTYVVAGQNKEMQTSLNSLLLAFALALFLVYIVMASQFESLLQPLLIMATVPLALVGVIIALWIAGIPISIMVFLGLIILAGIVVNNAIVLIDYINTLRDRGLALETAITEAGRARLRPILMTTLTTVLGLVPMALGLGEGAEIRAPMAVTVVVGLSASTLLTLVVIPTLYYLFPGQRGSAPVEAMAPTGQPVPLAK
ncbi:MAG: efflux RND transporter permease subunit [Opitutaceae bacterium]|nr:efflux RND transporter permease subunit [Opitutaceae bacterium]